MLVKRTFDGVFVASVIRQLWEQIAVDGQQCPEREKLELLVENHDLVFLAVLVDGKAQGFVIVDGDTLHTLFLPELRGAKALLGAQLVLDWIWKNTDLKAVRSYTYTHQPHVRRFALRLGFRVAQVYSDGATLQGAPLNRTELFLERPKIQEASCQQQV